MKRLHLTALAFALSASMDAAMAQSAPAEATAQPQKTERQAERRGDRQKDSQRYAERHAQRLNQLKADLKITPEQEGAWNQFVAAMQPPAADQQQRPSRADLEKLTTPQRIELMEQRQAERQARMKQRSDATKAFYAQLNAEQQKTFDERGARHAKRDGGPGQGWRGKGGYGGHGPCAGGKI